MTATQKGVPLPSPKRSSESVHRKYPFDTLKVGEMFFIPDRPKNNMISHASRMGRQLNRKFATRLCYMRQKSDDSWVPADDDHPSAVQGIGVWRTE